MNKSERNDNNLYIPIFLNKLKECLNLFLGKKLTFVAKIGFVLTFHTISVKMIKKLHCLQCLETFCNCF